MDISMGKEGVRWGIRLMHWMPLSGRIPGYGTMGCSRGNGRGQWQEKRHNQEGNRYEMGVTEQVVIIWRAWHEPVKRKATLTSTCWYIRDTMCNFVPRLQ